MSKMGYVPLFLLLGACAIGDPSYPLRWDPLPPPPHADCRHFEGVYADRGETPDQFQYASLSRELFGYQPGRRAPERVAFSFPGDGRLEVTVWSDGEALVRRELQAKEGAFRCEAGRLVIRDKRWVQENVLAAREDVTLELHANGHYLVARVDEYSYAMAFVIVPFIADATHWFRFRRLPAKGHP